MLERLWVCGSVAEAAVDLGLSPSATSRALQRLREALDDPLWVRVGNQLVPTERARALVPATAAAIETARTVFRPPDDFDLSLADGPFVLSLGDELQQVLLPAIVVAVGQAAPRVDLRVRGLTMASADLGRRDLVDLGIAPDLAALGTVRGLPDASDFVARPLYRRRFVVVGRAASWPEAPDLSAYVDAGHVLMSDEGAGRGFMDDLLALHGRSRRVACSVGTFAAVTEVVRATDWLATVPAEILPVLGHGLRAFEPPIAVPSMAMQLMWHPRHTTQPRHRALRGIVAEAVRASLPSADEGGGP